MLGILFCFDRFGDENLETNDVKNTFLEKKKHERAVLAVQFGAISYSSSVISTVQSTSTAVSYKTFIHCTKFSGTR